MPLCFIQVEVYIDDILVRDLFGQMTNEIAFKIELDGDEYLYVSLTHI